MNKKRITGIGGGLVAVVAVAVVLGAGVKKRAAAQHKAEAEMRQSNAPRQVSIEAVGSEPVQRERSYPGIVKASEETALSFRVGGLMTQVNVQLGETVKQGDVLMQLDPRDFEDRILALEARLAGANAVLQNAKQDYERVAELFGEKVVPQADYDRAKSALDSAGAAVQGIEAQLQIARHALKDTALLAPYEGTVTKQLVENHEMIQPGQVVLSYHNIQMLEVTVSVPENEIVRRKMVPGARVNASFPAVPARTFGVRLKEWSSMADPMTRSYAVTFEFEAPGEFKILPGMTADIAWNDAQAAATVVTIPVSALCPSGSGGSQVWVYDPQSDTATRRSVELGELVGSSRVVVLSGLEEGELIVVSGSRLIHEGLPLKSIATR